MCNLGEYDSEEAAQVVRSMRHVFREREEIAFAAGGWGQGLDFRAVLGGVMVWNDTHAAPFG